MEPTIVEKLHSLLFTTLYMESPVLSGNMKAMIQMSRFGLYNSEITIEAPFYDINEWKKNNVIVHTGEAKGGVTDYANWVNMAGGFGTHNKSMFWVNRACYEASQIIANQIGAVLINELPL